MSDDKRYNIQNLTPFERGNQLGRKHSDLQIAEIIAMHELGAGSRTISRLTKVPRSTVRMYTKVQRAAALIHSPEFQQEKDRIKKGLRNNPAWSRLGVAETKAEARQRLRAERQQRLADEAIPHTPVPTVQQVAKAKAEAQIERAATFQMHDKHGNYGSVRQDRAELLRKRVAGKVKRQNARSGRNVPAPQWVERCLAREDYQRVERWLG